MQKTYSKVGRLFIGMLLTAITFSARADVVAHWKFDETSGTTASDSGPNGYVGTMTGDAAFVAGGVSGNALQVSSVGNGYVRMTGVPDMNGRAFTLSAWVKTTTAPHQIVCGKHFATNVSGYFLAMGAVAGYGVPNKGYLYMSNGPTSEPVTTSDVNDGQWKLMTATYNPSGFARIYVNGVFEAQKPSIGIGAIGVDFLVGGLFVNPAYVNAFTGLIDDVQFYDRVLSDDEVAYLFANPGQEVRRVTGHVLQNSIGVPGVAVRIEDGANLIKTVMTDANGDYIADAVPPGTYTVRPTHNDKVFFPSTKVVTMGADAINTHFTAGNIGPVSITFQYPVVYSDQSRQGTLGLNVNTPVDRQVTMSDNSFKLTSPVKVTIPAGQRTANFFVYGVSVTSDTLVTVTAVHQGLTATQTITVRRKPALQTMTLAKTTAKGGHGVSGTVTIDQPAIGPMGLYLTSDNTSLATITPGTTAFYNGASSKSFYCKTFPVASQQVVTLTATFYGSTKTAQLTLTP